MEKRIGKIQKATFGEGGYQECCIGVSFVLGSDKESWGVHDFWGGWSIKRSDRAKWTEEERIKELGEMCLRLDDTMKRAKVRFVHELQGTPVEVTFDGNTLKEWRVLEEVI